MSITHIVVENKIINGSTITMVEVNYDGGSFRCLESYLPVSNLDDVNLVLLDYGDEVVNEDVLITYH